MFRPVDLKRCVEGREYFIDAEDEDYCKRVKKQRVIFRRRCDCSPDCNLAICYKVLSSGEIELSSSGFLVEEVFEKFVSEIEEEE